MKNRKRWISMALAGAMILQMNGILVFAEAAAAEVQTTEVQTTVVRNTEVQEAVETEI